MIILDRTPVVLLNQSAEWFRSEQGIATFNSIDTLADRIFFVLAFLKRTMVEADIYKKIEGDNTKEWGMPKLNETTSKLAVFLADAVYGSDLPYAVYPDLIDPEKNPFLNYWVSRDFGYGYFNTYGADVHEQFVSIILEENKKRQPADAKTFKQQLIDNVGENGSEEAFEWIFKTFPSTAIHDIVPSLKQLYIKCCWVFGYYYY